MKLGLVVTFLLGILSAWPGLAQEEISEEAFCRNVVDKGKKIFHQEEKRFNVRKKQFSSSVNSKAKGLMKALKKLKGDDRKIIKWGPHVPLSHQALNRKILPKLMKRFTCAKNERTFTWPHLKRCVSSWGEQDLWLKGDKLFWTLKVRPELAKEETNFVEKIDYPITLGNYSNEKKQIKHLLDSVKENTTFPGLWGFLRKRSDLYTDCMEKLDLGGQREVAQRPAPLVVPLQGEFFASSCGEVQKKKRDVYRVLKKEYDQSSKKFRMKRERVSGYLSKVMKTISKWGKFEWELVDRVSNGEKLNEEFQVFLGNSIYRIPCSKSHRLDTSFTTLDEDNILKSCRAKKGYERVEFGVRQNKEKELVVGIWANWIDEKERELNIELALNNWEEEKETLVETIQELGTYSFPSYDDFDRDLASQDCD